MKIKFHRDARRSKEEVGGIKVPYASAKRAVSQWRWYAILLGVAAPLIILATGLLGRTICITADGQIVLERFEVRAAAAAKRRACPALRARCRTEARASREPHGASADRPTIRWGDRVA